MIGHDRRAGSAGTDTGGLAGGIDAERTPATGLDPHPYLGPVDVVGEGVADQVVAIGASDGGDGDGLAAVGAGAALAGRHWGGGGRAGDFEIAAAHRGGETFDPVADAVAQGVIHAEQEILVVRQIVAVHEPAIGTSVAVDRGIELAGGVGAQYSADGGGGRHAGQGQLLPEGGGADGEAHAGAAGRQAIKWGKGLSATHETHEVAVVGLEVGAGVAIVEVHVPGAGRIGRINIAAPVEATHRIGKIGGIQAGAVATVIDDGQQFPAGGQAPSAGAADRADAGGVEGGDVVVGAASGRRLAGVTSPCGVGAPAVGPVLVLQVGGHIVGLHFPDEVGDVVQGAARRGGRAGRAAGQGDGVAARVQRGKGEAARPAAAGRLGEAAGDRVGGGRVAAIAAVLPRPVGGVAGVGLAARLQRGAGGVKALGLAGVVEQAGRAGGLDAVGRDQNQ